MKTEDKPDLPEFLKQGPQRQCCERLWSTYVVPLQEENERLKTTLVAGAELIKENWDKLCDEEGYGPQNLLLRMDGTLNTSGYRGYRSGEFAKLESDNQRLREEIEALKSEKQALLDKIQEQEDKIYYLSFENPEEI